MLIALGDLRICEDWLSGISCSIVRVTYKNKNNDTTVDGKKQLIMFLSLDMQSSILDLIRSMLDGMAGKEVSKIIDHQLNVELYISTFDDKTYDITLRPAAGAHAIKDDALWLSTNVDRDILDIVCANIERSIEARKEEAMVITL